MNNKNIIQVYMKQSKIFIILALFIITFIVFLIPTLTVEANTPRFKNKLSLLSMFKNETMNLKVWVDHYINQGVEKIYLIDNGSEDDPLKILNPYIESGIVKYFYLPEKHKQEGHTRSIIKEENLKEKTEWLIICDLDEFFYGFPKRLSETIDDFSKYDVVYSNWRLFGSDGLEKHPENITKSILWREPEATGTKKYIFKPSKIQNIDNIQVHSVDNDRNSITENEKIRLNHYVIQSKEYYQKVKMTRGDVAASHADGMRDMNYFHEHDQNKTFKDEDLANMKYD